MAKGKKGHYEMVLEDRHLLGVFFAVVLLCALFFTLGFVLGRNQAAKQAASSPPSEEAPSAPKSPKPEDLSFYDRVEGKQPAEPLSGGAAQPKESQPSTITEKPAESAASSPIHLQVAAVTQEEDAKRLADELRKKGFPIVVVPPKADRFYRVQVGPFENMELAEAALRRLQAQGFREIIVKR